MTASISATETAKRLGGGQEIALLDVREIMRFGKGHVMRATNLPLSRLELSVSDVVPWCTTPILLMDAGDGRSRSAK